MKTKNNGKRQLEICFQTEKVKLTKVGRGDNMKKFSQ